MEDSLYVERGWEVGCGGTLEVLHAFSGDFVGEGVRDMQKSKPASLEDPCFQ